MPVPYQYLDDDNERVLTEVAEMSDLPSGPPPTIIYSDVCPEGTLTVAAGQNVNDNGTIDTAVDVLDTNWSSPSAGQLAYAGTPDKVRLHAHLAQQIAETANLQRPAPVLELYRNGTLMAISASGYIRDFSDHEKSSNTIAWVDRNPGANPVYEIRSMQDALVGAVSVIMGQFTAEACTSEPQGGGQDGFVVDPDLRLTFFNQQQFAWGYSVANDSANPVSQWRLVIPGADYQINPGALDNSAVWTYDEVDNGDGTWDHIFTSTGPLGGNGSSPPIQWSGVNFGFNPSAGTPVLYSAP